VEAMLDWGLMKSSNSKLLELYDSLWQEAIRYFDEGQVKTDPYLLNKHNDRRRGLTVIARPSSEVIDKFCVLLRELTSTAPNQYLYQPNEFHVTILSLFTATESFEPYFDKIPLYRAALEPVMSEAKRFTVAFNGITASNSAVMVQGFPQCTQLNQLRDRLREKVKSEALGEGLDKRYRINTAHATIMRFRTQPQDLRHLIETLASYREYNFGQTTFQALQLVKNDWYMSSDKVEVLAEYPLL
jgi:2'-5' RNA ligase